MRSTNRSQRVFDFIPARIYKPRAIERIRLGGLTATTSDFAHACSTAVKKQASSFESALRETIETRPYTAVLAAVGIAAGLPLALVAGHFAQAQLIHTSQRDPLTLIVAVSVLPLLALVGTLLPARRATAINPTDALRAE